MILAIDQSISCTAYVVFTEDDDLIDFGCIKTSKLDGGLLERCDIIRRGLIDVKSRHGNLDVYCREGLGFGGSNSNASRDLAYLAGILDLSFCRKDSEINTIPPTSLKKFATGSGKAKKEDMIAALPDDVREMFLMSNFKKSTGLADLADAYFIGKYFVKNNYSFISQDW